MCLAVSISSAQTKKSGKSNPSATAQKPPRDDDDRYSFRDAEIRLIQDYYRPGSGHLPPGLANKEKLPAGLQNKLKRKSAMPETLEPHLEELPADLARQLPPPTTGCRRAVVGTTVVLIDQTTKIVHDLFGVGS